jgi:hypothetical protein
VQDSFLDEGFILDKKIGVGQPHRITDAKVLIANTPMDTDKIKIYGARVRVDSMAKVGLAGSVLQAPNTGSALQAPNTGSALQAPNTGSALQAPNTGSINFAAPRTTPY